MKLRNLIPAVALCAATFCSASPLEDFLKSGAEQLILRRVHRPLVPPTEREPNATASAPATPNRACNLSRATPLPALTPRPETYTPTTLWPDESPCPYFKFGDYEFARAQEEKKAFVEASKVRCTSCEGGYSYDAWANKFVGKTVEKRNFLELLQSLQIGQVVRWKGERYHGAVEATGNHAIGTTPCKQYHWTLFDGKTAIAQRDGLLCEYKAPYSTKAEWHEVV
jgi:hypothetical protein